MHACWLLLRRVLLLQLVNCATNPSLLVAACPPIGGRWDDFFKACKGCRVDFMGEGQLLDSMRDGELMKCVGEGQLVPQPTRCV